MKLDQALTIVGALNEIERTLRGHSDRIEDSIITGYETDQGVNFYISVIDELMEIGLPVAIRQTDFSSWPYEVYATLNGVEIRSLCTYADLVRLNLERLPVEYGE